MVKAFISVFLSLPEQMLDEKETFPTALRREYSIFMSEKHGHSLLSNYMSPLSPHMFIHIFQLCTFYHQQFLD